MIVRQLLAATLVAASLSVATACSSDGDEADVELPEFTPPSAPRDRAAIQGELATAIDRWVARGPTDYSYDFTTRCVNCLIDGATRVVDVKNGVVTSERTVSSVYGDLPGIGGSVEETFLFVGDALDVGLIVDARFDAELGYPTFVVLSSEFADRQTDIDIAPVGMYLTLL